jgi:FkbM family methyltransferase
VLKRSAATEHLGIRIPPDIPLLTDRIRDSIEAGRYEAREARAVSKLSRPGDVVLEVGSGIGFLSCYCAKIVKASKVVTFEANPELLPTIAELHALNGVTVDVRNAVLAAEEGEASFFIAPHFWGSSTRKTRRALREITVPKAPVMGVLEEVRPDVLIVDIEGGERDLVMAIAALDARAVVMELHPRVLRPRELNRIFTRMFALGYVYSCDVSAGPIVAFERFRQPARDDAAAGRDGASPPA